MNILYKTSNTDLLLTLSSTEYKVLFCLVSLAKHNLIDLNRIENKILLKIKISNKTLSNSLSGLVKKGILVRTKIQRVLFIEPTVFMIGYEKKIYHLYSLVNNSILMSEFQDIENKEREEFEMKILQSKIDSKRIEQLDEEFQLKEFERIELENITNE